MSKISQTLKYTLRCPVELKNTAGDVVETHAELDFRRMKGKHLRPYLDGSKRMDLMALMQVSASVPPIVFDEMDAVDVFKVSEAFSDFLGISESAGSK